jgi:hypothetical protein
MRHGRPVTTAISDSRWVDRVGCCAQRTGYPLPRPDLLQLLRQLGEQIAQRRQVTHPRLAVGIRYPACPRGLSHLACLVSKVARDHTADTRWRGQRDILASFRAGRRFRSST